LGVGGLGRLLHRLSIPSIVARDDDHALPRGMENEGATENQGVAMEKIKDRLPSREQLAKRNDPSDWRCALSRNWEDFEHIFFNRSLAKFM
jgi:hypothetical protein